MRSTSNSSLLCSPPPTGVSSLHYNCPYWSAECLIPPSFFPCQLRFPLHPSSSSLTVGVASRHLKDPTVTGFCALPAGLTARPTHVLVLVVTLPSLSARRADAKVRKETGTAIYCRKRNLTLYRGNIMIMCLPVKGSRLRGRKSESNRCPCLYYYLLRVISRKGSSAHEHGYVFIGQPGRRPREEGAKSKCSRCFARA